MKKLLALLSVVLFWNTVYGWQDSGIKARLGKVELEFMLDDGGRPAYSLSYNNQAAIRKSYLGFALSDDSTFYKGFKLIGTDIKNVDESWSPVWGEVSSIRNHYQQLTVQLQQVEGMHRKLDIVFRVFEDGLGFRYKFPAQGNLNYFIVTKELTEFALVSDAKAFWIPADYDSNEYAYSTTKITEIDNQKIVEASREIGVRTVPDRYAVQTPLMLKTDSGLYMNIHEAALLDYSSMQLHVDRSNLRLSCSLVPDATGNMAYLHAPALTPWRTIVISNKASDILASKMILNLNEPSKIENTSWIKPMKFVGLWWEMQIGKSSWSYADSMNSLDAKGHLLASGRHGAYTANVKRYIDFASEHGIPGVLVEGWNIGWEDWFGNWKENVFDFVTPYPDFDVAEVSRYAKAKGISLIMHHETSGSVTNYERRLDTAYRFMDKYGYPAVKTGYVGRIIPRGEHHDGQWMVNHYLRVAQKAASHRVMLDVHESVRPTGLHRTYPNWMANEAGRGNEYYAFSEGNTPEHETILPFTRLMGGPMDYTPGIFKLKGFSKVPNRQVRTTLAKQLALYVTLYSPLQMVSDLPENYQAHLDAFQFIKDVGVDWDDTRILEAEPGDYITIARKSKGTQDWFVGAITDENSRSTKIKLSFLTPGKKYKAVIYADADDADWKINPEAYKISTLRVDTNTELKLKLAKGGGAAIRLVPIAE